MGVLSWRGLAIAEFSAPPSGETMHQTAKSFRGARTCSRFSITMPSLVGLGFHPLPGWPKTLIFLSVCLSVCLSVRHALERQRLCARFRHEGVGSRETILMPLDRGRFVVVYSRSKTSNFSDWCQLATPINAEVQKRQKLGFFANRRRQNKPIETKFGK